MYTTMKLIRIAICNSTKTRCKGCGKKIGKGNKCVEVGADGYKISLHSNCARKVVMNVAEELGLKDELSDKVELVEFRFSDEREVIAVSVMYDKLTEYKFEKSDRSGYYHKHTITGKIIRFHW